MPPRRCRCRVAPYEGYKTLRFERHGRVLRVTIDRAEMLNAVNEEMHDDLSRPGRVMMGLAADPTQL